MNQQWDYRGFFCEIYRDGDEDNRYRVATVYVAGYGDITLDLKQSQINRDAVNNWIDTHYPTPA